MTLWILLLAGALLLSSVLFVKGAVIDRELKTSGLMFSWVALALFAIYYSDRSPLDWSRLRSLVSFLDFIPGASTDFRSSSAPLLLLTLLYVVRGVVFFRTAWRRRVAHVGFPIANLAAGSAFAITLGALVDSLFRWGWVGATVMTALAIISYLGAVGLMRGLMEVSRELASYALIRGKRAYLWLSTRVVRFAAYLAALSQRLVPNLDRVARSLKGKVREEEAKYQEQGRQEDEGLAEAHARYRERQRMRGETE